MHAVHGSGMAALTARSGLPQEKCSEGIAELVTWTTTIRNNTDKMLKKYQR
jgi:hypothetical protein